MKVCNVKKIKSNNENEAFMVIGDIAIGVEHAIENEERYIIKKMMDMYIATTSDVPFGASIISDNKMLHKFWLKHGDFYIIPSSVHELIFMPAREYPFSTVDIKKNIFIINRTTVSDEDFLSDKLFKYNGLNVKEVKTSKFSKDDLIDIFKELKKYYSKLPKTVIYDLFAAGMATDIDVQNAYDYFISE